MRYLLRDNFTYTHTQYRVCRKKIVASEDLWPYAVVIESDKFASLFVRALSSAAAPPLSLTLDKFMILNLVRVLLLFAVCVCVHVCFRLPG